MACLLAFGSVPWLQAQVVTGGLFFFTFFYTHAATAKPMHSRFASVYSYDFELFRQRFLGEEGATQLKPVVGLAQCTCSKVTASSSFHAWKPFELQAIDRFWETMRPSEFFRQHPVLSDPATFCTSSVGAGCLCNLIFFCTSSSGAGYLCDLIFFAHHLWVQGALVI